MKFPFSKISDIKTASFSGGTPLTSKPEYYNPPSIPWLKTKEVNYRPIYETESYISELGLKKSSAKIVPANSVIVAMYGQGETAGRVAINKIPLSTNQACFNLMVNPKIADYRFIYYALVLSYDALVILKNGGAQPNLNAFKLNNFEIPCPELAIQTKIGDILSQYDELIEVNRRRIAILEEMAMRTYREWFVFFRFPGHETTEFVDGLPKEWEYKQLEEITDITMGQSPSSDEFGEDIAGMPFHQGVADFGKRYVSNRIFTNTSKRIAPANSILFSVRAPVGRINITSEPIVMGRGLCSIMHKLGIQSYIYYALKDKFFEEDLIGGGSIFASASKKEIHSIQLINPTIEILAYFNELIEPIDNQIRTLYTQNSRLQQMRDRLLPQLMSGQLEVTP